LEDHQEKELEDSIKDKESITRTKEPNWDGALRSGMLSNNPSHEKIAGKPPEERWGKGQRLGARKGKRWSIKKDKGGRGM